MRGEDKQQGVMYSYINLENRVPQDHPLRRIRAMVDCSLKELSLHFEALYSRRGATVDSAGAVAACVAAAGFVLDTE